MSNITTIRVSGQTYQISDSNAQPLLVSGTNIKTINNESLLGSGNITIQGGGGGNNVIEVTQAEYDALVSAGTLDLTALYVITDATEIDISNYWTSAQTQTAINRATSGKQDTLIAGDNITISGNVISASGGGSTYSAGRGIDITNDEISFSLPISANTDNSVVMGGKMTNSFTNNGRDCLLVGSSLVANTGSDGCLVVGYNSSVNGDGSAVIGWASRSIGDCAFAFGNGVSAKTQYSFAVGRETIANNQYETALGHCNKSNTGSTDAENTLFSVGNGTSNNARHNAFEIRSNGDIYISSGGTDIKLQDNLGGGTVDPTLDSGSTNAVANSAITTTINEIEEVTAAGLNALNDKFDGLKFKRITQEAYDILPIKDENTMYIITSGATSWITIPSGTSLTGLTAFKMRVKDTIQLSESHDVSFGYAAMGETSGNTYTLHYDDGMDVWQKWRLIIDGNYVSDMEDLTSSNGYYTVDFGQKYPCIGGDFDWGQQTTQDAPFEFEIYI